MEDEERLSRLTPRERDVYEVWKKHPDWDDIRIGYEVKFPAAHVVRRYKRNIKRKLGEPWESGGPWVSRGRGPRLGSA